MYIASSTAVSPYLWRVSYCCSPRFALERICCSLQTLHVYVYSHLLLALLQTGMLQGIRISLKWWVPLNSTTKLRPQETWRAHGTTPVRPLEKINLPQSLAVVDSVVTFMFFFRKLRSCFTTCLLKFGKHKSLSFLLSVLILMCCLRNIEWDHAWCFFFFLTHGTA